MLHIVVFWLFAVCTCHAASPQWSTKIAGGGYEGAFGVAVDIVGNTYVVGGTTTATNFPVMNALQPEYGGGFTDGFIAKFSAAGEPIFTTYFGGSGHDFIYGIAIDQDGNIVIAGNSHSVDLPITEDAFQPDYNGGSAFGFGDGFIAKLTADGSKLLYCSFFGGFGDERISSLALDPQGNLAITGQTDSRNLPLKVPIQSSFAGGEQDGFVAKFDRTLTNLIFSTYLGGDDSEGDQKIATDPAGFVYASGWTLSTNFPVTSGSKQEKLGFLAAFGRKTDAVVTKFIQDGSKLVYSTYLGSALNDTAYAIAADEDGSAYITGESRTIFENVVLGFQPEPDGQAVDAYIAKLAPDGSKFTWFSYLGGSGEDRGYAIALDANKNILLTGLADSFDFPIANSGAMRPAFSSWIPFFAKVSANGQNLLYSTILNTVPDSMPVALAVHPNGEAMIIGQEGSFYMAVPTDEAYDLPPLEVDALVMRLQAFENPTLDVTRSGRNVLLSWATNFTAFRLEQSTQVAGLWEPVSPKPLQIGRKNVTVESPASSGRIYRLRSEKNSEE